MLDFLLFLALLFFTDLAFFLLCALALTVLEVPEPKLPALPVCAMLIPAVPAKNAKAINQAVNFFIDDFPPFL